MNPLYLIIPIVALIIGIALVATCSFDPDDIEDYDDYEREFWEE